MIQQSAGDSVMQGVPVLTAVELAIGTELLETEQVLAEELQSDKSVCQRYPSAFNSFSWKTITSHVVAADGEGFGRNSSGP